MGKQSRTEQSDPPIAATGDAAHAVAAASGRDDQGGLAALAAESRMRFEAAMDDDFNAPEAVAALFDLARAINRARGATGASPGIEEARTT